MPLVKKEKDWIWEDDDITSDESVDKLPTSQREKEVLKNQFRIIDRNRTEKERSSKMEALTCPLCKEDEMEAYHEAIPEWLNPLQLIEEEAPKFGLLGYLARNPAKREAAKFKARLAELIEVHRCHRCGCVVIKDKTIKRSNK